MPHIYMRTTLKYTIITPQAVGPTQLAASLLPALLDLAKDPKWRVRMAVISKSSMLVHKLINNPLHVLMMKSILNIPSFGADP